MILLNLSAFYFAQKGAKEERESFAVSFLLLLYCSLVAFMDFFTPQIASGISASQAFIKYIEKLEDDDEYKPLLAEYLDAPIAIIDYAQDDSERSQGYIIGDVEGKKAILIDDILNTGRTFSEAARILERDGATEIYAVSSHGLFVDSAAELLDAANIKEILVTDSVLTESKKPKNVKYITASELIGDAMVRIHSRKPVSPLFK